MTLPITSVRTSSVRFPSSSRAISRCCSSRPDTPGVSINRFNSASFSAMLFLSKRYARSLTTARGHVKVPGMCRTDRLILAFLLRGLLFQAPGLEQLAGEVETEAEVVDEVEDGEGQNKGVGFRHLPEYRGVACEPHGRERQGELAKGDRARRVDVADRDEDQERAGHEHGGEHKGAWMEDDGVEGDDVEVAWEAEEVVVLGLGVHAAELVAAGKKRQRGQDYPRVAVGQVPFAPEQDHGGEDVGHVVHDVVEERPIEERECLADPEAAGQETVGAVDEERDEHQPQRLYGLTLKSSHEH